MKKLLLIMGALMIIAPDAYAQRVSKGDIQRLDLDQITLDGTVITATGAEINALDGITATVVEVNRMLDVSGRIVSVTDNTVAITEAAHSDTIVLVSASGGNQTITLPDGGTATGARYLLAFGADAPAGDYSVTVAVPSGDNSSFVGSILAFDEDGGLFYNSAGVFGQDDTMTFTSGNTERGDFVLIASIEDSAFHIDGALRFESVGEDTVLFSSAVASVD